MKTYFKVVLNSCLIFLAASCATQTSAVGKEVFFKKTVEGSDISELPELYPQGEWLPISAPLLSMHLQVRVKVNGQELLATLDTGAQSTVMSKEIAAQLQLPSAGGRALKVLDAHGNRLQGERRIAKKIELGKLQFDDVNVTVLQTQPDLFLIGQNLLEDLDLFIAGDEGLVGLFKKGQAPQLRGQVKANLIKGKHQILISGNAPNMSGDNVNFKFIVDTGAQVSSVPVMLGVNQGLPAELRFSATTLAVGGEENARGRFLLNPLSLGTSQEVSLGKVLVLGGTLARGDGQLGLLGNDVMMRFYTIISTHDAEIRFAPMPWRAPYRILGPDNKPCLDDKGAKAKCIEVKFKKIARVPEDALEGLCLSTKIHKAYAGHTVEMSVVGYSEKKQTLFNGGALRIFLSVGQQGDEKCFSVWKSLGLLGVNSDTPLSLRFVRTEHIQWPCDPMQTTCVSFTGPLPEQGLRDELR